MTDKEGFVQTETSIADIIRGRRQLIRCPGEAHA